MADPFHESGIDRPSTSGSRKASRLMYRKTGSPKGGLWADLTKFHRTLVCAEFSRRKEYVAQ
jgi:hypothetical protein